MGYLSLGAAVVSFWSMLAVCRLATDMRTPLAGDPYLLIPVAVAPSLWLMLAAGLTLRWRTPVARVTCAAALATAAIHLLILGEVYRQWHYIHYGSVPYVFLLNGFAQTTWLPAVPYPASLLALGLSLLAWRQRRADARREDDG